MTRATDIPMTKLAKRELRSAFKGVPKAPKGPKIEVDAELWAESGGTIGMFGKAWKEGRLTILPSPEDPEQRIYRIDGVDQ